MASEALRVKGLRDLQRAFAVADKKLAKELRTTLKDAAEPVRAAAEGLAVSRIRRGRIPWHEMRVGVTQKSVYVAPKQRGRGSKRRNLAGILMDEAMLPALESHRGEVEAKLDEMLGEVGRAWERV